MVGGLASSARPEQLHKISKKSFAQKLRYRDATPPINIKNDLHWEDIAREQRAQHYFILQKQRMKKGKQAIEKKAKILEDQVNAQKIPKVSPSWEENQNFGGWCCGTPKIPGVPSSWGESPNLEG